MDEEQSVISSLNFSDVENKQVERYFGLRFTRGLKNSSKNCSAELFAIRLVILSWLLRSWWVSCRWGFWSGLCVQVSMSWLPSSAYYQNWKQLFSACFSISFSLLVHVSCAFVFRADLREFCPRQHHVLHQILVVISQGWTSWLAPEFLPAGPPGDLNFWLVLWKIV